MVISSIDLKDGHVVQLKNGKDLVLQRDDAEALISDFNKYGEVAVIDLDQALRNTDEKGNTNNDNCHKRKESSFRILDQSNDILFLRFVYFYHSIVSISCGCSLTVSDTINPFLTLSTRSPIGVIARLCVITITVIFCFRQVSCKSFKICLPVT